MKLILLILLGVLAFVGYQICKPMPPQPKHIEVKLPEAPPPVVETPKFDMNGAKAKLVDIKARLATVTAALADLREKNIEAVSAVGSETLRAAAELKRSMYELQDKIASLKEQAACLDARAKSLANEIRSPTYVTQTQYVNRNVTPTGTTIHVNGQLTNPGVQQPQVVQEQVRVQDTSRGMTVAGMVDQSNAIKGNVTCMKAKLAELTAAYEKLRTDTTAKLTKQFNTLMAEKNALVQTIKTEGEKT